MGVCVLHENGACPPSHVGHSTDSLGVRCESHGREPLVSSERRRRPTGAGRQKRLATGNSPKSRNYSRGSPAGDSLEKPQKHSQEKEPATAWPHRRP